MTDMAFIPGAEGMPAPDMPSEAKPPKLTDISQVAGLSPGSKFIDPTGVTRVKPYEAKSLADVANIPEGAQFLDPTGTLREKPKYEGVGFTAQYLYDAALTENGKKQALERAYPGKVKEDPSGGYYVEDDNGVFRKPGRGVSGALGAAAEETAPAIGMTAGGVLGALGGSVEPGGGTAAGAFGGGVLGAMAGRQFNNVMLSLAGIHEGLGEQVRSMGWEGAATATGDVAGEALAHIPGAAKATTSAITDVGRKLSKPEMLPQALEKLGITPSRARQFLGTTDELAQRAASVTHAAQELGINRGLVAPSVIAPESPFLHKIEDWDLIFRKQNVFAEAGRDYFERASKDLLERPEIGASVDTPLTRAEKKVSGQLAGQRVLTSARFELAHTDAHLENAWRQAKDMMAGQVGAGQATYQQTMEQLAAAQKKSAESAKNFVDAIIADIHKDTSAALKELGADEAPGVLFRKTAAQFQGYNTGIRQRAKLLYDSADVAGGEMPMPNSGEYLGNEAREFMARVPDILRSKYPAEIRNIAKLAGTEADPAAGIEGAPATDLTFKEMRQLRSWLRHGIDYNDLTPDMREGSLKLFEKKVNGLIHDNKLPPQFKQAAEMLDTADGFYKQNIPFLHDSMVKSVMKGIESGAAPNPEVLADVLFDPTRLEAMRKARQIVGEPLWRYVQAANANKVIRNSLTLNEGEINGSRFADQIEKMVQSGLLETAYDKPFARRMLEAAQNVRKLEGAIPIKIESTDTLSTLMRKAQAATEAAKEFGDKDPMKALSQETRRIDKEYNEAVRRARAQRRSEPLRFLYEDSMSQLANRAANKILGDPDLLLAAADKFGRDSPEFKALQQVAAHRFFQRPLGKTGSMFTELGGEKGMTEEVQQLLFPGVTRKMMLDIVKNMDFLFAGRGGDVGSAIAGASRVLNPWSQIPIPKPKDMGWIFHVPGVSTVGRLALGKAYALVIDGVRHPNFIYWLTSEMGKGETERLAAREVLQQRLAVGGWLGAAAGQLGYEKQNQ